ncbi:MAG: ANTAR domain-containing protein [Terracoccus sp.]
MTSSPTQAFARAMAALVRDYDTAGVLAQLLDDAQTALQAAAVRLLIRTESGDLELLTATSPRAAEPELIQAPHHDRPCIDAGFVSVQAFALQWHEVPMGTLHVFYRADTASPFSGEQRDELLLVGQAFADISALVLVQQGAMDAAGLRDRTERALTGRTVIEQAKGVISFQLDLPIDQAYTALRDRAANDGVSLTAAAKGVVNHAAERSGA